MSILVVLMVAMAMPGELHPLTQARIFGMCQEPSAPEDIENLAALGCDVIVRGLSCAWHANAEQARQRMQGKAALLALSRKRGITFCSMITSSALFADIVPPGRLDEWSSRDARGRVIQTNNWHQGCLNNPEFRSFIRDIGRAVIDAGADGLHYDESYSRWFWMKPIPCFCDHCCAELRNWLAEHFSPAELQQRWGIKTLDSFDYRAYLTEHGWDEEPWRSPLHDQWWQMQLHSTYRWEKWIVEDNKRYARQKYGRELVTNANQYQLTTLSAVLTMESRVYDFINIGTGLVLHYRDHGDWRDLPVSPSEASFVPTYRMARAHAGGKPVVLFLDIQQHPERLAALTLRQEGLYMQWLFAEAHLCGCHFAAHYRFSNYEAPLAPQVEAARFLKRHAEWYEGSRPAAKVAVLFSFPSQIWDMYGRSWSGEAKFPCHAQQYYGVCQALLRANIQWDTVFTGDGDIFPHALSGEDLRGYEVVIAPGVYCANDTELKALARYVASGGKLLVTGPFAQFDGHHEKRSLPLPEGLKPTVSLRDDFEPAMNPAHGELDVKLVGALVDELGLVPQVAVANPSAHLQVTLRRPHEGKGWLVDLVNTDFTWARGFRAAPAGKLYLHTRGLPDEPRVTLYEFARPRGRPLLARSREHGLEIELPAIESYALVRIEP